MEEIQFVKDYKENMALRTSFNALAEKTFGLNFEAWYRAGFWGGDYIPFSAVIHNRVIANVSVNHMGFVKDGRKRFYLQLGTVMTDKEYRMQGLSRRLMEWIFKEYEGRVDGIYLFANDTVLDFYPRFGFRVAREYQYYKNLGNLNAVPQRDYEKRAGRNGNNVGEGSADGTSADNGMYQQNVSRGKVQKVCLESPEDWKAFAKKITAYHPQGNFTNDNLGLLMFYASGLFKDSIYYIEALDAYAIAETEGDTLILYDVYAKQETDPEGVAVYFYPANTLKELALGFTPKDTRGYECREYKEDDTTVFVKGQELQSFLEEERMFPLLSHA